MALRGSRQRKRKKYFDLVVVPDPDNPATRRFRLTWTRLVLMALGVFVLCAAITVAIMALTPAVLLLPASNAAIELKYGRQIVETQERLNKLAEDVLLLRDYNTRLRIALGEKTPGDTTAGSPAARRRSGGRAAMTNVPEVMDAYEPTDAGNRANPGFSVPRVEAAATRATARMAASFPLVMPTSGYVSQNFDPSRGHYGMDVAGKTGTPVYAAADGVVMFSGWTSEFGHTVILSHGNDIMTVYKHNQMVLIRVHSVVKRGEPIALLGSSGRTSQGPHLHFEVWRGNTPQDPNQFLLTPLKIQ